MENKFTPRTSATWLRSMAFAAFLGLATSVDAQTTPPMTPTNFKADADYNKVVLSWENPVKTEVLLTEGFEGSTFPSEGWNLKTTNTDYFMNTWFQFPTAEMEEEGVSDEDKAMFIHGGDKSALVYPDMNAPHEDGSSAVQNEWLYLPKTPDAEFISFYTYINPMVLEYGESEDFPDHYYVKVSHDDGQTWDILWDGRKDIANIDAFQYVTLYLGDSSKGAPIVAFQAVGDTENPETGLYFAWAVDDVTLSKTTGDKSAAMAESYNVYYDDEIIAENIHATTYTDLSDKEPGKHVYSVEAVANSLDLKSEKANLDVNIKEPSLNAPTNVKLTYTESEDAPGKYNVQVTWDAPEGDRTPVNYSVYCNNALVAGYMQEMEVEQTGKPKGAYTYQVVACYQYPEGESDPTQAEANIAIGTRFPATNFTTERNEDGTLTMNWNAPKASEYTLKNYEVYRGNTKLGETTATTFTETDSPKGIFDYAVKAVYTDDYTTLPAKETVKNGEVPTYTLPFSEDFTGGLTPENWTIEKIDGKMQDQYLWRFDNWFELPIVGGGFSGDFASLASSVAGYTRVWSTLDTPPLVRGTLTDGEKTWLEFDLDYCSTGKTSEAGVYYSYDGENWAIIGDDMGFSGYASDALAPGETCNPEHIVLDITDCFKDDTTPVYIAWSYKGKVASHMAIDNVKIYNSATSSIAIVDADKGYSLSGNVLNVNALGVERVQVLSASGVCLADMNVGGAKTLSLPLSEGVNIVKIVTDKGIKTLKVNR